MTGRSLLLGLMICAVLALTAEAQFGGGRGPAGGPEFEQARNMMDAMNALRIEPMWAVLSLGGDVSTEQLGTLRTAFSDAWNRRLSILEKASNSKEPDWPAIKGEFDEIGKNLEKKIGGTLTKDQRQALLERMDDYEGLIQQFRRGRFPRQ